MFVRKINLIIENLLITSFSGLIKTTERTRTFQDLRLLYMIFLLEELVSGLADVHSPGLAGRLHSVKKMF